ncbi:MAG: hypothetical protein HN855_08650 [Anaerolineae bacterium]|jgi:hypothetical protein|nr:hypothetical protein [Anaerolineae bacterium]MBT7071687.1 hypothetical protein [Anaerolineae bacterium]MBT7325213.1 hypothetical protein [Anaerolineae bacterium]
MAFKKQHVEKWIAAEFPGEKLVSMVASGLWTVDYSGTGSRNPGDHRRTELVASLGLDQELQISPFYSTTFYALTEKQIILGTRSGFSNRPKDIIHAAPLDGLIIHWFDDTVGPNRSRNFVTIFSDGKWRADKTGLTALGRPLKNSTADEFVKALGSHAKQVLNP